MPKLILLSDDSEGTAFRLDGRRQILLGKDASCEIPIIDDLLIASRHCQIYCRSGIWQVEAVEPGNEIWINDTRSTGGPLIDGDFLRVGNTELQFRETQEAPRPRSRGPRVARRRSSARPAPPRRLPVQRQEPKTRRSTAKIRGNVVPLWAFLGICVIAVISTVVLLKEPEERPAPDQPRHSPGDVSTAIESSPRADTSRPGHPDYKKNASSSRDTFTPPPRADVSDDLARLKKFAGSTLVTLIEAGDFTGALRALDKFESTDPLITKKLEECRHQVMTAAQKAFEKLSARLRDLETAKQYAAALKLIQSTPAKFPAEWQGKLDKLALILADEKEAHESHVESLEEFTKPVLDGVFDDLVGLDFARADARLEKAREQKLYEESNLRALAAEVKRVKTTWEALRAGLENGARTRVTHEFPDTVCSFESRRIKSTGKSRKGKILAVSERTIQVRLGSDWPPVHYKILSLPDNLLLALLWRETKRDKADPEVLEDLGLLLLHAEGPARAQDLLLDKALGEKRVDLNKQRLETARGRWLTRKMTLLQQRSKSLTAATETALTDWAALAEDYLAVILNHDPDRLNPAERMQLKQGFLSAEAKRLSQELFFNAKETESLEDGRLRLLYDFSKVDQARDFTLVDTDAKNMRITRGRLFLKGELRWQYGKPFADELQVSGRVSSFNTGAPNINVALWTTDSDTVTFRDGRKALWTTDLLRKAGEPNDFFLFGIGYKTVVTMVLETEREEVTLLDTREPLPFPAFVLLGGNRGKTLHRDAGEGLWGIPMDRALKKPLQFSIAWARNEIIWKINKRSLNAMSPLVHSRLQKRPERLGSVTLMTNDDIVLFDELEIVGRLNPQWIDHLRQTEAAAGLTKLAPKWMRTEAAER